MPAILPASRLRAGMRARRTSTTRLAFSSTTPLRHHGAVGRDGHEEQDGHDERGGLVVGASARHVAELDVGDRHGGEEVGELVRG